MRNAPTRHTASTRYWQRHVEAGERVSELLDDMRGCADQAPGLAALLDELEAAIAEGDSAAWHAIAALEREQLRAA